MNRIESICSFINDNDLVVDVGCDQVKVGILLSKRNVDIIHSKNCVREAIGVE